MRCDPILVALARGEPIDPRKITDQIVAEAVEHRMATVLLSSVQDRAADLPAGIERRLVMQELWVRSRFRRNEQLLSVCVTLASELGLEIGTVKGVTTAERLWPKDPEIRNSSDVDVFLRPSDLPRIGEYAAALDPHGNDPIDGTALIRGGYLTNLVAVLPIGVVELHRDPIGLNIPLRRPDTFWHSTQEHVTRLGATVRVLKREALLVELLMNSARDNYAHLMQVAEIGKLLLADDMDWSEVERLIATEGWGDIASDGVSYICELLGVRRPPLRYRRSVFRFGLRLTSPESQRLGGTVAWQRAQRFCKLDLMTQGRRPDAIRGVARRTLSPPSLIDRTAPDITGPYLLRAVRYWKRRQDFVTRRMPKN
jgi:hypothetical protein